MNDEQTLNQIIPAIRMICSVKSLQTVKYISPSLIAPFLENINTLDQTISEYIQSGYLRIDNTSSPDTILNEFLTKHDDFHTNKECQPKIITINDTAILVIANNAELANLYKKLVENIALNEPNINPKYILQEIHNTDTTQNKLNRKVENKVFVVTGGAQGFGEGIVRDLYNEGANIVIADLNTKKGSQLAKSLNSPQKPNKVAVCNTNVSSYKSVEDMIIFAVKEFGGLDVLISNAGILKAGSLEEMTAETFELITMVNYTGYFYCTKYISHIMKQQWKYNKNHYMDVIQINSKSGLKGSNKNFAYAGGKFGGVGLTQSFALELIPFNIKVNSICPGNFFDGPLWADPEHGLFIQYLKAGKVPGAKTIEDVRRHYEQQVPAKRGCEVEDVMKAIYYVIDQKYETGQSVPVTGGQIMLH